MANTNANTTMIQLDKETRTLLGTYKTKMLSSYEKVILMLIEHYENTKEK